MWETKWPLVLCRSVKSDMVRNRELPIRLSADSHFPWLSIKVCFDCWSYRSNSGPRSLVVARASTDLSRSWQGLAWILSFPCKSSDLQICVMLLELFFESAHPNDLYSPLLNYRRPNSCDIHDFFKAHHVLHLWLNSDNYG